MIRQSHLSKGLTDSNHRLKQPRRGSDDIGALSLMPHLKIFLLKLFGSLICQLRKDILLCKRNILGQNIILIFHLGVINTMIMIWEYFFFFL